MKSYSVGKFAHYTGVTPDFIKYYEKHNIMYPQIEENGYRSYEISSFATLNECIKYRDMGFSASDIRSLMKDSDYRSTINILNENIPMLKKKLAHTQIILEYVTKLRGELPKYSEKNPWTIENGSEMYYLPISENFDFIPDDSISELLIEWQKYQPAVISAAHVDYRSLYKRDSDPQKQILEKLQWGVLISKADLEKLELQLNAQVLSIPSRKYLTVYDRRPVPPKGINNNPLKVKELMFRRTSKILQEYPFQVIGPSFFIVHSKIMEDGIRYTYQKVLTPIE